MANPFEGTDSDTMLRELRQQAETLEIRATELHTELANATATATSPDGAVTATLSPTGALQNITFSAKSANHTPEALGPLVMKTVGVLLVSWLPARRAARLVLDDLSSDVANSSLVIRFRSRVKQYDALCVSPDSLQIMREHNVYRVDRSCRLSSVSAVAVRTATGDGEYPVPGKEERLIQVTRGEVVVIDLPAGKLVCPSDDAQQLTRFIEERMRRATVEEDGRWL